jgi:branched-chain amino acid transport system substrate-binding protein
MRKYFVSLVAAACVLGGATAFAPLAHAATSGTPYNVNIMLPITGPLGFLGSAEQHDIQIEQGVINAGNGVHGHPVKFVFYDDQSTPQISVQVLNQIMATGPKIIVGTALVASCNAMAPRVKANGPVLYCLSPGVHPQQGSFMFSSNVSTSDLFSATLRYYRLRGWTRLAILTSSDASGQDAARGIQAELAAPENKGLVLVAAERFNPTDVSADAQIQSMKAANPQAIIVWTSGTPLGTVLRAISNAGWNVPVATTDANMLYRQMAQYKDFMPKQFYIASPAWLPAADEANESPGVKLAKKQMFDAFKAAGQKPDMAASLSWDPTMIAVTALNSVAPDATPDQVRQYLMNLKGYNGTTGVYDMHAIPQRGVGLQNVVMTDWNADKSEFVVVSGSTGTPF